MKTFIIAEIGINHNGDLKIAKKMIEEAKIAGADAVKFQKRDIFEVYSKEYLSEKRESPWGKTQLDQKKGLEFGEKEYQEIDKFSKKIGIKWFASAWDLKSLEFLDRFNFEYNKIASAMIVDINFLTEVAKRKKYTFISTGMCEMKDIAKAVKIFKKNNCKFELMHCISAYPFDSEHADLRLIKFLSEKFKCNVGYSGHEKSGVAISYAAVVLGATSIERHFTLDRNMYGTDQAASIQPEGLRKLVGGIRQVELALSGKGNKKKILDIELTVAKKLREHLKI
jgi:N-acetylneuraminate synthase